LAKSFTSVQIRQMNLDCRDRHARNGIANGHTGMRISARIDEQGIGRRLLYQRDDFTLDIRLVDDEIDPPSRGASLQPQVYFV
jgi:hypothetical protein